MIIKGIFRLNYYTFLLYLNKVQITHPHHLASPTTFTLLITNHTSPVVTNHPPPPISPKPPHNTSPPGRDTPISYSHLRFSNREDLPGRTGVAFFLSKRPWYWKFSSRSMGRSFYESIPILKPILFLKILKRFF